MSLLKWNRNRGSFPAIPSFFERFGWEDEFNNNFWVGNKLPSVNISETDDNFLVEVAAPGMAKKDFNVEVKNGMLTISAEKEDKKVEEKKNLRREEFNYESFERSFRLPENVSEDEVTAKYDNGVLKITLTKVAVAEEKSVKVEIA